MTSGGARARSGPAPDPNALRRNRDAGEWLTLPAEGRKGKEPRWPLAGEPTPREAYLWRDFWKKPQAIAWQSNGQEYEVALLVRRYTEAEAPLASANLSTLVRQMMDSLGLTVPGLRSNRWRIADAPTAAGHAPERRSTSSARGRLTVVPPPSGD